MVNSLSYFNAPSTPADGQSYLNVLVNTINAMQAGGQTVQTQSIIAGVIAGTQTQTSGTLSFANSNGVTFGMSNSSVITVSVNAGGGFTAGASNLGNTLGTTGGIQSQILFAGGNNVTLSQSINGQSATLTVVGANVGVSGISAGTQSASSGAVIFSNSNGISFGMSNSSVVTASVTPQALSLYAASNTTQSTSGTANATNLSFAGAGNISIGVTGGSVVVSGPTGGGGATLSRSMNFYPYMAMTPVSFSNGQENIVYFPCAANLSASRADILLYIGGNLSAATTGSLSITQLIGIYTNNGGTLSSLSTASATTTFSAANNTYFKFDRNLSMPFNINMTPGDYFIMNNLSVSFVSTSAGGSGTINTNVSVYINPSLNSLGEGGGDIFAPIGVATNASLGIMSGAGVYSVTSNAIPATINLTGVNISQTNYPVCLQFRNI